MLQPEPEPNSCRTLEAAAAWSQKVQAQQLLMLEFHGCSDPQERQLAGFVHPIFKSLVQSK
jgi:hypothetical protein